MDVIGASHQVLPCSVSAVPHLPLYSPNGMPETQFGAFATCLQEFTATETNQSGTPLPEHNAAEPPEYITDQFGTDQSGTTQSGSDQFNENNPVEYSVYNVYGAEKPLESSEADASKMNELCKLNLQEFLGEIGIAVFGGFAEPIGEILEIDAFKWYAENCCDDCADDVGQILGIYNSYIRGETEKLDKQAINTIADGRNRVHVKAVANHTEITLKQSEQSVAEQPQTIKQSEYGQLQTVISQAESGQTQTAIPQISLEQSRLEQSGVKQKAILQASHEGLEQPQAKAKETFAGWASFEDRTAETIVTAANVDALKAKIADIARTETTATQTPQAARYAEEMRLPPEIREQIQAQIQHGMKTQSVRVPQMVHSSENAQSVQDDTAELRAFGMFGAFKAFREESAAEQRSMIWGTSSEEIPESKAYEAKTSELKTAESKAPEAETSEPKLQLNNGESTKTELKAAYKAVETPEMSAVAVKSEKSEVAAVNPTVITGQNVAVQVSEAIIARIETVQATMAAMKETAAKPESGAAVTKFEVTLNPEHLGKVEVKLIADGMKLSVLIIAANEGVRELLQARAQSVRVMAELTGVTVERYEVVTAQQGITTEGVKQDFLDKENGGNQSGQEHDESSEQGESEETEAEFSFAELVQLGGLRNVSGE
jgi:flagellar hook-length control protein FliK